MSNCAQLLVFARYATKDSNRSELLLSNALRTTTRGEVVFGRIDNFFKKIGFQWSNLVGCTIDGVPAMLGKKSEFQSHVKAVSTSAISVHCFIHRFAFAARGLSSDLKTSLNLVAKTVNYIKTFAFSSRFVKVICEDIESE